MNNLYLATSVLLCAVQVVNGVIYNDEKLGFCSTDESDESCLISIHGTGNGFLQQFEMEDGNAALFGAGASPTTKIQNDTMIFFSATKDALALNPDPLQSGLVKTGKYNQNTLEFSGPVVTSNVKGCSAVTSNGVVAIAKTLGGSSSDKVYTQMYIVEKGTAADNYDAGWDKAPGGKWVKLKQTWDAFSNTSRMCTADCATTKALPFASFKAQGYGTLLGTSNGKFIMPDGTFKEVPGFDGLFSTFVFKGGSNFSIRGDIEVTPGSPKCFKTKQDGTCEERISIAPDEVKMLAVVPSWTWTETRLATNTPYACATIEYDISVDGDRMDAADVKLEFKLAAETGDTYVENVGPTADVSAIRWVTKGTGIVISKVQLQVTHMIDSTQKPLHNFVNYQGQDSVGAPPTDVTFSLNVCAKRTDYSGTPGTVYIDPSVFVLDATADGPN